MGDVNNYNNNFVGFKGGSTPLPNGGQSLWQLPVPNVSIYKNLSVDTNLDLVDFSTKYTIDIDYQMQFLDGKVPYLKPQNDLTTEQINQGVWCEMLHYGTTKRKRNNLSSDLKGIKKFKVHTDNYFADPNNVQNSFQDDIIERFNASIPTRGGKQQFDSGFPNRNYQISRPNQIRIDNNTDNVNIFRTLNGLFTIAIIPFQEDVNTEGTIACMTPIINNQLSGWWGSVAHQPKPYIIKHIKNYGIMLRNLYIKYRYIMWNPSLNNGKGNFVVGPTTETIKISPLIWPFSYQPQQGLVTNKIMTFNQMFDQPNWAKATWVDKLK